MYIFKVGHLVLDDQLSCCALGRTTSPVASFFQLPVVVCVGLRPCGLFSIQFVLFIDVILGQLTLGSQVGETLQV